MNLYEDATLEHKFEQLSDQLALLVLDLLLAGLHQARQQTQTFQEFAEVKAETETHNRPF
jgi:hypothetical protein